MTIGRRLLAVEDLVDGRHGPDPRSGRLMAWIESHQALATNPNREAA